ncbi:hypothetical protein L228DRAFT_242443 [Xylona heveae TC161]|uniref:Uncharacterized protein n=1 Tax=Xylona heveae (strain CBS 132557 / TC161) TaxID=1328760 RepID=A0A165JCD6_XYLHT|nr:hypothetical protein L228DRAFT_242443 [Xylona heveae TC161]KZF26048.1 hypothetical protein L228DRAFT_242443 [Xylona heveae TC161]
MKLRSSWLLASSLCVAGAAATSAPVYTFNVDSTEAPAHKKLSPETARLVLAQRLGLSEYHSLSGLTDESVRDVNDFGGKQASLFDDVAKGSRKSRLLVMVEGVKDVKDLVPSDTAPAFSIKHAQCSDVNERLMSDLSAQNVDSGNGEYCNLEKKDSFWGLEASFARCSAIPERHQDLVLDDTTTGIEGFQTLVSADVFGIGNGAKTNTIIHLRSLETIAKKHGVTSRAYKDAVKLLSKAIASLQTQAEGGLLESTIVLNPETSACKKTSSKPYGSYDVPTPQKKSVAHHQRRQNPEVILSEAAAALAAAEAPASTAPATSKKTRPSQAQTLRSSGAAPKGILPVCHNSLDSCISATNNCSGHGSCFAKGGSSDKTGPACYTCGCVPTVRKNSDGTVKTTHWGGPACQKKDVSMPFFLLAGFTVTIIGVISWGIGLLFSIGNEELPSVIGAGVVGPRAK